MSLVDTAENLLARLGRPMSLTYETDEVRDPATGAIITPATENVVSGVGYPGRFHSGEVDGSVIQRTDTRLLLNKVSVEPSQGWRVDVRGKTLRVMDVQPITRSGDDLIYICQLRV